MLSTMTTISNASIRGLLSPADVDIMVAEMKAKKHRIDSVDIQMFIFLLALAIFVGWLLRHKGRLCGLHESSISVALGLIAGALIRYGGGERQISRLAVQPCARCHFNTTTIENPIPKLPELLLLTLNFTRANDKFNGLLQAGENVLTVIPQTFSYVLQDEYEKDSENRQTEIQQTASFNPELFFYFLLPPIIFDAGYGMHKKSFFDNFGSIVSFALPGTLISIVTIAGIMYLFSSLIAQPTFRFIDFMYFGSFISATDPVTTLAIFQVRNWTICKRQGRSVLCLFRKRK